MTPKPLLNYTTQNNFETHFLIELKHPFWKYFIPIILTTLRLFRLAFIWRWWGTLSLLLNPKILQETLSVSALTGLNHTLWTDIHTLTIFIGSCSHLAVNLDVTNMRPGVGVGWQAVSLQVRGRGVPVQRVPQPHIARRVPVTQHSTASRPETSVV